MKPALLALCTLLALGTVPACRRGAPDGAAMQRLPQLPPPPPDEVLAEVNGHPISVADVAAQARASGHDRDQALRDLIDAELVAQDAEARGLVADREVQARARGEMVRRLLKNGFEVEATPDKVVTEGMLHKAYQRNHSRLVHPELRMVDHLLVMTPKEDPKAAALAEEIRKAALQTTTQDQFVSLEKEYADRVKQAGFTLRHESITASLHSRLVEEFIDAAFALRAPGDISPVVRTEYGYHVLRIEKIIPAENHSYEESVAELRKGLFPQARKLAFDQYVDDLGKRAHVTKYPERLRALQEAEDEAAGKGH